MLANVSVESLAWLVSYGKTNCITNDIYSQELSHGRVLGLGLNKLREGTVAC